MTPAARARVPRDTYVTVWKDPESRGGLLTYVDGKETATRTYDEVIRATDPSPHVLANSPEDREFLDEWLAAAIDEDPAATHTHLAIPAILARDILGWDLS